MSARFSWPSRSNSRWLLFLAFLAWGGAFSSASFASIAIQAASSADIVERGEQFFYSLTVTNTNPTGGAVIDGVQVEFTLPAEMANVAPNQVVGINSVNCQYSYSCRPGSLSRFHLGLLRPGESRDIRIPMTVLGTVPVGSLPLDRGTTFAATYTGNVATPVQATLTTRAVFTQPLDVRIDAGPLPLAPNSELNYVVTLGNRGSDALLNGQLEFTLPASVQVVNTGGGTVVGSVVRWTVPNLAAGKGDQRRLVLRDTSGVASRVLKAQAQLSGAGRTARSSHLAAVRADSPLRLAVVSNVDPVLRGEQFFYRIVASNVNAAGGAVLENVSVRLTMPRHIQNMTPSQTVGAGSWDCSYSYRCDGETLAAFNLGSLAPGESRELQLPVSAEVASPFGSLLGTSLYATYLNNTGEYSVASITGVIEQSRPLDVSVGVDPAPSSPSGNLNYRVLASNNGMLNPEALLSLEVPGNVQIVDPDGGTVSGRNVTWQLGSLPSGKGVVRNVRVRDQSGSQGRLFAAEAQVRESGAARWAARASALSSVRQQRPLEVRANLAVDPLGRGTTSSLVIDVRNTNTAGAATLQDISVRFVLPVEFNNVVPANIEGAASSSCWYSYRCDAGTLTVVNVASLAPGQTRQVRIPLQVRTSNPPPLGTLVDFHIVGAAKLPDLSDVQQVLTSVSSLIGEYDIRLVVRDVIADYYQTILSRSPDSGGLGYWTNEALRLKDLSVDVNEAFRVMAGQFFNSPEYLGRNTSSTQFVTDLYRTFFRREPEAGGLNYWTGQLAAGVPRDIVMFNFLFSPEFSNYTGGLFGTTVTRPEVSLIVDFYRGLLGRLPDSDGFGYWLSRFRAAQCVGSAAVTGEVDAISRLFANLPEYAARGRSNAQYVADLYYGFLRRGGDLGGFNAWNNALATRAMSREDVRWQFMLSPEFQGRVNQAVDAGCLP